MRNFIRAKLSLSKSCEGNDLHYIAHIIVYQHTKNMYGCI